MTAGVREQSEVLVFREQDARLRAGEAENDGGLARGLISTTAVTS
ncbi:MAG TPA: hypothetical protein VFZ73_05280 [Gemmatimonadaceae bacterium]